MATIEWARKQNGIPLDKRVIITKTDGTTMELQAEYTKFADDTTVKGSCVSYTSDDKSVVNGVVDGFKDETIDKVRTPTGVRILPSGGNPFAPLVVNPLNFDKITIINCLSSTVGGKRKHYKKLKNRRTRRRQVKNHRRHHCSKKCFRHTGK